MNFESNQTNTQFQLPPVGAHAAKLVRIIDIGTQETPYKDESGKPIHKRQSVFTWELPFETLDDGTPLMISKFYTQSVGEKANLTKDLTSWLGKAPEGPKISQSASPADKLKANKEFTDKNIKPLLGKGCQVVISERDNGKQNVSAVVGLTKGTQLPEETHHPIVFFDLDNFDEEIFENISDGLKKIIMKSPEYARIVGGEEPVDNSDIPF